MTNTLSRSHIYENKSGWYFWNAEKQMSYHVTKEYADQIQERLNFEKKEKREKILDIATEKLYDWGRPLLSLAASGVYVKQVIAFAKTNDPLLLIKSVVALGMAYGLYKIPEHYKDLPFWKKNKETSGLEKMANGE